MSKEQTQLLMLLQKLQDLTDTMEKYCDKLAAEPYNPVYVSLDRRGR